MTETRLAYVSEPGTRLIGLGGLNAEPVPAIRKPRVKKRRPRLSVPPRDSHGVRPRKDVWRKALSLAGGDARRLVTRAVDVVVVANSHAHAVEMRGRQ
jgi:hypothetical protein